MTVRVLLFAAAKSAIGAGDVELTLPDPPRVDDLRVELQRRYPELRELLSRSWIAVNQRVATGDLPLSSSDEIAWIPPVSGG